MKLINWLMLILLAATLTLTIMEYFFLKNKTGSSNADSAAELYLSELMSSAFINENLVLRDPVVYIGSDRSHEFLFSDLISDNCLVFRFSGEACNVCIDFVISRLKDVFGEKYTCSRILLIGSNINERVKENYYGKPVISFTEGGLGLPFEEYNTPFLFIVDRDKVCNMFFIPEKTMPELTDAYLNEVKKRYFNQ